MAKIVLGMAASHGPLLIDYQPLYRSAAGTGSGMAFAYWRRRNS